MANEGHARINQGTVMLTYSVLPIFDDPTASESRVRHGRPTNGKRRKNALLLRRRSSVEARVRRLGSIPGWLLVLVAFAVLVTLRFVSLA